MIEKLLSLLLWVVKMIKFAASALLYFVLCGLTVWIIGLVFPQIYGLIPQLQGGEILWGGLIGLAGYLFMGNFDCHTTDIPQVEMVEATDEEIEQAKKELGLPSNIEQLKKNKDDKRDK